MDSISNLSLGLGLIIFSFLIISVLIVPFIDILYKLKITRRKEASDNGKVSLFDRLHDKKAGTPVGGGVLLVLVVSVMFVLMFPIANHMGIRVQGAHQNMDAELFVILFTFISYALLGAFDDLVKIFGRPRKGSIGMWVGLSRKMKFLMQWILAFIVGFVIYNSLGIHIIHIPLVDITLDIGWWYVPFSALVVVSFTNAFNITDGLDGLSSGLLLICLIAFSMITATTLDTPLSIFIALWIGALIAFLYFNVWPARVMLGDAGALSFGATLGVIGLLTGNLIALIVIGGIFVIEIMSSAIQIIGWRILKRPIFPLAPVHHAFLAKGWEEPKIVSRAWLAGIMLAIFGLWLSTI